jgi:hypothetical protein
MRPLVVALLLAASASGCARLLGGSERDVVQSVPVSVDSTLRIAATQLRHHGYTVTPVGDNSLVTTPRAVPDWLGDKEGKMKGRQWFVQVNAEPHFLARGTRIEVVGYLMPEDAPRAGTSTTPSVQNAITVTSQHQLYQEVRAIATWIGDAARRK